MIYKYEAKDEGGKTVSGTLEAETEQTAASLVRQMGYYPMRFVSHSRGGISPGAHGSAAALNGGWQQSAGPLLGGSYKSPFSSKPYGSWFARKLVYPISTGVSSKDLSIFFREFASMLKAGVPITRCLQAIGEHHHAGLLGVALRRIKQRVEEGDSLTNAFGEFPYLFSDLQRAMISAGEESGGLDLMLMQVSDYLEHEFMLREMIKRETFMTKIEIVASIVLPPLYIWVTQGWGAYYRQVLEPAIIWAAILVFCVCAFRTALKTEAFRNVYDTIKAFVPWFGGTVRMLALAKFARAFAALYSAGVLIPRGLTIAAKVTANAYMSSQIARAVAALMGGATLSQALSGTGAFPPMFISMVNTGETTGSLDLMLLKVADFYEDESRTRLQASVKALGVILLIAMGVVTCIVGMKALGSYVSGLNDVMNQN